MKSPSVWFSTSSPNRIYTVQLTGNKGRGGFLFYNTVRFNVIRNGQTIVRGAHAHSGDFMDISFELAYTKNAWLHENVIRFWREPNVPETRSDTLFISNRTDKVIKYLKVKGREMFLVFEIQPRSSLKLSASHQPYAGWVESEGEFIDGQPIRWNGVNFATDRVSLPLQFCVSITDTGVEIESPEIEGYNSGSVDQPNIPKAINCMK
ncbi:MAG TPA: hypothetical protein VFZ40_20750 [Pyrinomonadaceae bacterium]